MPSTTQTPDLERDSMLKDIDIPGVKDRDPDPKAGPRLNVKEFRIQGLVEYPGLGITREKLIKQVEDIRFDMMGEGKQLPSGYTLDELSEVSNLIADIEKETEGEHVGPVELQRLVFLIREQRRSRGITLGMIEAVAETVTRFYRERGFILAKAYIPKQQVRDGVVTLTLLLGELGEVNIQNNKRYKSSLIENMFKEDLAKPVTNERIEEKLFFVNDLPGVSAQGYFEPGSQVGDTKLNVNLTSERWYDADLRVDNHGSERSGLYRAYADFSFNNPTGTGDQINLGVLDSFSPQNSTYGSIKYSTIVMSPRVKASIDASTNDFVLSNGASAAQSITGKSMVNEASLAYQFTRSRLKNYSAGAKAMKVKTNISVGQTGNSKLDNTVQNFEIFADFDVLKEKSRTLQQGAFSVVNSDFIQGAAVGQPKSPTYFTFDYSLLTFMKIPFTDVNTRAVLKAGGQYSGVSLAAVNQFALAGPTRARGYQVGEFNADDALYLGADLVFKGIGFNDYKIAGEKLENVIQPFLFLDGAYGRQNVYKKADEVENAKFVDLGFGLKIDFKNTIRGNLVFAQPVFTHNSVLKEPTASDKGLNVYFDMQYSF